MKDFIKKIVSILAPSPFKTKGEISNMASSKKKDVSKLAQADIDHKLQFASNSNLLKKYFSDKTVLAYNVIEDTTHKGFSRCVLYAYDKEVDEDMTVKQLADLMTKKFDGVDKKFDAIDDKFDAVDKKFDEVKKEVQGINDRIDNLVKKNKLVE